jgi:hypothetical protein
LHAATAAAICGLADPPPELLVLEPPDVLVVALPDVLVDAPPEVLVVEPPDVLVLAGVEVEEALPPPEDDELELLPQPATTAPLSATTDNTEQSLLTIDAPL